MIEEQELEGESKVMLSNLPEMELALITYTGDEKIEEKKRKKEKEREEGKEKENEKER